MTRKSEHVGWTSKLYLQVSNRNVYSSYTEDMNSCPTKRTLVYRRHKFMSRFRASIFCSFLHRSSTFFFVRIIDMLSNMESTYLTGRWKSIIKLKILFSSHRIFAHRIEVGMDMRLGTNLFGGHLLLRELNIHIDIHDTHVSSNVNLLF